MLNRFILPLLTAAVIAIALALPVSALAQAPFTVDVHDSVVTMREGQLLDLKATITNLTLDPIEVRAIRFQNEVPGYLWYTAMCYGDQCYPPNMDTTPAARIGPGASLEFKLTVGTEETTLGTGTVRASVRFDTGNNTPSLSRQFVVNIDGTSAAPLDVAHVGYAWPNPARANVTLPIGAITSARANVQLIDAMGATVVNDELSTSADGVRIDVSTLSNGVYVYRIVGGRDITTGRIVVAH